MAETAIVDAGFLVALLRRRDTYHNWAAEEAGHHPPPWQTCEAVLSEAFHMLNGYGVDALGAFLEQGTIAVGFALADHGKPVVRLMKKYAQLPMSLADACVVRMSEIVADPVVLTTDSDFRIYRRHGRQKIPHVIPRR